MTELDKEVLHQSLKCLRLAVDKYNQTLPIGTDDLNFLQVYDYQLRTYEPGKNWPMPDVYPNPKIFVAKAGLMNWQCNVLYPMTKGFGTGQVILSLNLAEMVNLTNQAKADQLVAKAASEKYFLIVPPPPNVGRVLDT